MAKNKIYVIDLVKMKVKQFSRKEHAPGKEYRSLIYCKDCTLRSYFGLSKAIPLPAPIPENCIRVIDQTRSDDGNTYMVITSYGDDIVFPPIWREIDDKDWAEVNAKIEELSLIADQRKSVLDAEKRSFERSKDEKVKEALSIAKEINQPAKQKYSEMGDYES